MSPKLKTALIVVILLAFAVTSFLFLGDYAASPECHSGTITSLNEKQSTVLKLAASATAASTAISILPGDAGTPIAEKLADLSSSFLLVLSVIFLEKYLLTITGFAAFKILLPIACLLLIANFYFREGVLSRIAGKLVVFSIAILLVVPVSIGASDLIESTYETSIEETIAAAEQFSKESAAEESGESQEGGVISSIISDIKSSATDVTKRAETVLNNFIESLAVILVISCAIPVVVVIFFIWVCNMVLGSHFRIPRRLTFRHRGG